MVKSKIKPKLKKTLVASQDCIQMLELILSEKKKIISLEARRTLSMSKTANSGVVSTLGDYFEID